MTVLSVEDHVRWPIAFTSARRALTAFGADLATFLRKPLAVTSFFRSDGTSHNRGCALDVALRGGRQFALRSLGRANYYRDRDLISSLKSAGEVLGPQHPGIGRMVIEIDHVHVDTSMCHPRDSSDPIPVFLYGPGRCNALACDEDGIGPDTIGPV